MWRPFFHRLHARPHLLLHSFGRVYPRKGYQIPEAGRAARGTNIVNILPTDPGERVVCMLPEREGAKFLFLCTKNGTVKRMNLEVMRNIRKNGIRALNIDEDDELISACVTDGSCNILLAHGRTATPSALTRTTPSPMGATPWACAASSCAAATT